MSFLTPLYLLGALAIGLPILFHLIRRTPRGRQVFSSVMFLEPSPPRITRRSRIEHWLLLCLRGLAVCLLAIAFARPFLRQQAAADVEAGAGRWIAILLDTSASMRREGLWHEAVTRVRTLIESARPDDRLAVYTFDSQTQSGQPRTDAEAGGVRFIGSPRELFGWDAWTALDPVQRASAALDSLQDVEPSWRDTDLGRALVTVAANIEDAAAQEREQAPREVIVVSDLQAGSRLDALQDYEWPEGVTVRLQRVGATASPTNAGLHALADGPAGDALLRVRVTNADDSARETFRLRWLDEFADTGATASATDGHLAQRRSDDAKAPAQPANAVPPHVDVYVPPGQARVVRAPPRPEAYRSSRLVLTGDDHPFDNTCFVVQHRARDVTIVYLGSDASDDQAGLRFFIEPLFSSTRDRTVEVVDWSIETTALPAGKHGIALVILTEPPRPDQVDTLRRFADAGGQIVYVARSADSTAALYELAGVPPVAATEAEVNDYSMLSDVDFRHPIFAPLADPRFSDFTKLHFWKHRRIDVAPLPDCRVLARFDDGDPAIGEVPLGNGRIVFFAAGWNHDDSQLAVWSKFVPLMNALLESGSGPIEAAGQFLVGQPIRLAAVAGPNTTINAVRLPDGSQRAISGDAATFDDARAPGIYTFEATDADGSQSEVRVAVNLAAAESRTTPLGSETLEAAGVRLAQSDLPSVVQAAADRERQLLNRELENRQKLWRWLIVAALAVLVVETVLAGRLAARPPT